jgi:hypothetical protein
MEHLLVKEDEIRHRWLEYFDKLFNGENGDTIFQLDDSFNDTNRHFVYNNNNKAFLSQARWGRIEMKPHMNTSELNPQRKKKGDKGKGEPKNDETGKHIKRDKTHKNQQGSKI